MAAAAGGLALAEAHPVLVVAIAALACVALVASRAARLGAVGAAVLMAGALAGDWRLAAIDGAAARIRDGELVELRAHLRSAPRPGPFGASAEIQVAGGRLDGARLLLRIPRWSPLPAAARPGAELRLRGQTTALGSGPFADHLRRRGLAGGAPARSNPPDRRSPRRRGRAARPHAREGRSRGRGGHGARGGRAPAGYGPRPGRADSGRGPRGLPRQRSRPPARGLGSERDAARGAGPAAADARRREPALAPDHPGRPRGPVRPAGRGRTVAPARRGDGPRGDRGDGRFAPGVAVVRPVAGRRRDPGLESARVGRSRLAALVRRRDGHPRAGSPARPASCGEG